MTVILSSGYGRLHLAQSAEWLGRAGVWVGLVCGWVPKNPNSWLVRLCSKFVGRNLSAGMKKRAIKLVCGQIFYVKDCFALRDSFSVGDCMIGSQHLLGQCLVGIQKAICGNTQREKAPYFMCALARGMVGR